MINEKYLFGLVLIDIYCNIMKIEPIELLQNQKKHRKFIKAFRKALNDYRH